MARPIRLQYPGAVFHITQRGNERRDIFVDDSDRERFLELLAKAVERFGWILTAFVLMTNHYHLVVQLTEESLSRGLHWLNASYSQWFNRRHDRVGHLFQGRFKAVLVDSETYFLEVVRYVVLNPVRAGMVSHPCDFQWSSFPASAGLCAVPEWLAADNVRALFGDDVSLATARYTRFVEDGIGREGSPWADLVGQVYLGSESWIESVRGKVECKPRSVEHPRTQRDVGARSMDEVVGCVARTYGIDVGWVRQGRGGTPRMVAAWLARREAGLTLRLVADGLGVSSVGHVSKLVHSCEVRLRSDDELRESVAQAAASLHASWKSAKGKT
jgi:putative transposase